MRGTQLPAAAVSGRPERLAARVILLDPGNRVLLMRYDDGPPNGSHWTTPGGGLNEAEDYPAAALRELAEETGWNDIALLGEATRRTLTMEYGGRLVRQHERLYLARTDQACREIRGVDAMHAADGIAAWRWWTTVSPCRSTRGRRPMTRRYWSCGASLPEVTSRSLPGRNWRRTSLPNKPMSSSVAKATIASKPSRSNSAAKRPPKKQLTRGRPIGTRATTS